MSNRLIINPGTPEAWAIELHPGANRIGSAADNEFVIPHSSVSGHHCELTVTDDGVLLKDLGSTNGTFVAQVPVTEFKLQNGHRVQLGAVEMIFESQGLPVLPDAVNLPADGARILIANPSATTPPAPPLPPGLRVSRPTENVPTASTLPGATTTTPPAFPAFVPNSSEADRKSLLLGSIGAIVGGLIGMFVWYYLIRLTEREIGWVAWGVGGLTGFAAQALARRGSHLLGIICGACALIAIIGGTYLAAMHFVRVEIQKLAEEHYQSRMHFAQAVSNAKSTEEIRSLLAAEDGAAITAITDQRIREFQGTELPGLREFASGKPSREEFTQSLIQLGGASVPKLTLLKETLSLFTLLWLFLGVGTAYKLGAGR